MYHLIAMMPCALRFLDPQQCSRVLHDNSDSVMLMKLAVCAVGQDQSLSFVVEIETASLTALAHRVAT